MAGTFRKAVALTAVACFGLVLTADEAQAYKLLRDKGWHPDRVPVSFTVNPAGIPFAGVDVIKYGALMWSNKPQFDFAFKFAGVTQKRPMSSPGSEHVCGMSNGLSMGVMAMNYFRFRNGYMDRFNIAYNARQRFSETRFTNTVIHEFGHAIGLGHTRVSAAVMEAGSGSGNRLTDLHQDDINGAIKLYPPSGNRPDLLPNSLADPEIVAPKGSVDSARPAFQWTAVVGATGYEVALDSIDAGGQQTQLVRTAILPSNTYAHPADLPPGRYYWWVRSRKNEREGTWVFAEFTVTASAAPAPGKPDPQAPLGVATSVRPAFSWSTVAGATQYDVSLDVLDAGGNQVNVARLPDVQGTTVTFPDALEAGKVYRWWVRAKNASGQASDWGFGEFTVQPAVGKPTLIAPSGTVTGTGQTFSWTPVPGATHYELQVHRAAGGALTEETQLASPSHAAQVPVGAYYWWVRAMNGAQGGEWVAGAFSVAATGLTAPTLTEPTGTVSGASQTFTWSSVPGATGYELSVQRAGGGVVLQEQVAGTAHTAQLSAASYYWWVRAVRGAEASAWASGSFTLQGPSLKSLETRLENRHETDEPGMIPHLAGED